MNSIATFTATIYVGRRVGYSDVLVPEEVALATIQDYVDEVGWCVSVAATQFIYTRGREPGFAVGIIQYPRFPITSDGLRNKTLALAEKLRVAMQQLRVSVVFQDVTVLLGEP
jgi:hypothetical protein